MQLIILLLISSAFGSFLHSVQAYINDSPPFFISARRLKQRRSACPHCEQQLAIWQLLPIISWLLLRGRCHYCQAKIALRYLRYELAFCVIALLSSWAFDPFLSQLTFIFLSGLFWLLTLYDLRYYLLPDYLNASLLVTGLIYQMLNHNALTALSHGAAALSVAALLTLFAQSYYRIMHQHGLGYGDIKLAAALCGWFHLESMPRLFLIASLSALLVVGIRYAITKTLIRKLPFGPYILLGAWLLVVTEGGAL